MRMRIGYPMGVVDPPVRALFGTYTHDGAEVGSLSVYCHQEKETVAKIRMAC